MKKGLVKKLLWGGGAIVVLAGIGYLTSNILKENAIYLPTNKKIEAGYINPSRLSITVEDKNKNGESEVYLHNGSDSYALTIDQFGTPVIKRYEVIPGKTIPAKTIPPQIVLEK